MKLIALSIAWLVGIYIGSLVSPPLYAFLVVFIFSLLIALLYRGRRVFLWTALCLIVLFGGIGCYQWRVSEPTLQPSNYSGTVEIVGEVERDPEFEGGTARLSLSAQEIRTDGDWEEVCGDVLIYTRVFPSYSQGDLLKVKGELQTQQGFRSTMSYPEIELMERGWLFSTRNRLSDSLSDALPEPEGSLAQALLLGIRSHVPDALRDSFASSGTFHLMAISGLHLAILAGVVLGSAAWLFGRHRPTYLVITFVTIWLYASLTGMRPPVFRAAIMFSLFLAALWLGRPRSALPALALAAAIMVGLDPSVLREVSFQLSFVAVAGIILLVPPFTAAWRKAVASRLEEKMSLVSVTRLIVYPLIVTTAAIVAVYPLIAYYFKYVSLVGLPATFFALLALPGAIILALLTALLGLFAPALSWAVGCMAWLFLTYIIEVVEGFGGLSSASHRVDPVSGVVIWVYYAVFVAILARRHLAMAISKPAAWVQARLGRLPQLTYRLPKRWVVVPLLIAAVLVWLAVMATPDRRLEVSFLDVGQGDAILIETPSGQQILVDGGPDPEKICLELGEELPSWDKSLDLLVLTHAEEDHLLGLVEVLSHYKVGQVLESGLGKDTLVYEEWLRLIGEKNIEPVLATAGQQIELGDGITIEVLHPQGKLMAGTESDANNNSVVLRLYWKEVSFLLTGDIFEEAERVILHNGCRLNSTVLKVAHHGSATSTSPHFLAAVDPQVAVVCVGQVNPFGHPHDEVTERLDNTLGQGKTYLTSGGTVTFTTDGKRLWVEVGG